MWWWRSADWGNTDSTHRKKYKLKKWYFFFLDTKDSSPEKKEKKENSFGQKWKKKKILLIIFFHWKKKSPEKNVFTDFFFTVFDTWKIMYLYIIYILCSCENSFFHPLHTWKKSWFLLFHCFMEKKKFTWPETWTKIMIFFPYTVTVHLFFEKSKKKLWQDKWTFFFSGFFFTWKKFLMKKNHLSVLLETNLCSCENFFFSLGPTH